MPLAQGLEAAGQLGIEHQAANIAAVVLLCRARPVGRQGQQGWCTAQGLLPVLTLLLQHVAAQPVALPHGIVGVLHRQGGQRILGTGTERGIERTQLTSQYIRGPAVGDDMVHGHQQHMVVIGHAHQTPAHQWSIDEVEVLAGLLCRDGEQLVFAVQIDEHIEPVLIFRRNVLGDVPIGQQDFTILRTVQIQTEVRVLDDLQAVVTPD